MKPISIAVLINFPRHDWFGLCLNEDWKSEFVSAFGDIDGAVKAKLEATICEIFDLNWVLRELGVLASITSSVPPASANCSNSSKALPLIPPPYATMWVFISWVLFKLEIILRALVILSVKPPSPITTMWVFWQSRLYN